MSKRKKKQNKNKKELACESTNDDDYKIAFTVIYKEQAHIEIACNATAFLSHRNANWKPGENHSTKMCAFVCE